jgi:RNA polymerase sigma-70 factor (ECF subfamily)
MTDLRDAASRRGDAASRRGEAAFREALVGLIPALRAYGRALGGSLDAADELVQQALLAALASPTRPDAEAERRAWMFVILRNAFLSGRRREGRAGRHAAQARALEPPPHAARDTDHPGGLAIEELNAALARLPPALREAAVLMGAQGLSAAEAARICGVTEGSMRARLSRARGMLRATLGPRHPPRSHP